MKRKLRLILLFCMTLAQFSCGAEDAVTTIESTYSEATGEAAPDYPLPEADFDGESFGILCRTEKKYEMDSESENGETLNDAVYQRNRNVEERYNINLECYDTAGSWDQRDNFYKVYTGSVMAGEDIYDLVAYYEATAQVPISEGCMLDLNEIKSLDFSHEWWYPGYNDIMTINGKLYSCLGDAAMTTWEYPAVTFFNKNLMDRYGMEYPYQAVMDGKWTFDMLCELGMRVSEDLNGDGKLDGEDLYGWITSDGMLRCMPTSFDFPLCVVNDGVPELSVGSEKYYDVYDRVYNVLWENDWATVLNGSDDDGRTTCFTEGRALFYSYDAKSVAELREMNDEFGILPYPKYNEAQDNYYTVVFDNHSVFCVPKTVKDPERSGLIMEAMGYESMRIVTPAYYEIMLRGKVARDDESRDMLDIIRDSFQFDFAIVNSMLIDNIFPFYGGQMCSENQSIASEVASKLPVWQKKFRNVLGFYGIE